MTPAPSGARSDSPPRRSLWASLTAGPEFYRERTGTPTGWFEALFEPAMLISAIVLFSQGLVQFGRAVAPTWNVDAVLYLCGAGAVAGYLYSRRLMRGSLIWPEWLVLLAPPILLLKFTPYIGGDGRLADDLAGWLSDPWSFVEIGWVFRALLLLGAWATAFYSTQDLSNLRVQRGEVSETPAKTIIERAWESDRIRSMDHTYPLARLAGRFLGGGIGLIFLSALTASAASQRFDFDALARLLTLSRPSSSTALLNVLAYFVVVLLLLIEGQYVRSRTLWTLDRVWVAPSVPTRWGATGIAIVAIGLLAALLAPTEGLLGFGEIVRFLLGALMFVASYLVVIAYFLFWLITYPLRLLMGSGPDEPVAAPPQFAAPVAPDAQGGEGLLEVVKSLLFWVIVGGLVAYSLVAFWRQRGGGRLAGFFAWVDRLVGAVWSAMVALARLLLGAAQVGVEALRRLVPVGAAALAARRARLWAEGTLPGRDPRRIVLALYGLMAARAAEQGLDRRVGQTALEYRSTLREGLPEVVGEIDGLTEAFQEARYSRKAIVQEDAGRARRAWLRIRQQLTR